MNEQKRIAPIARMLRRAKNSSLAGGDNKRDGKNGAAGGDTTSAAAIKAKAKRAKQEYWQAVVKVIPPKTIRVMKVLEKGLTMYNQALLKRKELFDDVTALQTQNAELKTLLKQYLGAPINEDLIIPPTQMQMYQ